MALLDKRNEFADATSVAGDAGTALIGEVIDLGSPGFGGTPNTVNFPGDGTPLYFVITTDTEIITGGSAGAIQFFLVSDAAAAIAVDGSATVHYTSPSYVTDDAGANSAELNAGGVIACVPLPLVPNYERFLGVLAVIATTTVTAGKINAFLTRDPSRYIIHKDALAAGS